MSGRAGLADLMAARPRLLRLAYRLTGVMAEAEDLVQEMMLRFHRAEAAEVREPAAWATTVVTRLALDHLRRRRREAYVGSWLPGPVADDPGDEGRAAQRAELADDLSLAFLMVLDRLSPGERAAFLLHDAFGHDHAAIAAILGKSEAAVRQLVSRGRARMRAERPEIHVPKAARDAVAARFIAALVAMDGAELMATMAEDAVLHSDGGGKRRAALNPIRGADRVLRFFVGIARKNDMALRFVAMRLNGAPGLVALNGDMVWFALVPDVTGERVTRILLISNPDKLGGVEAALTPA
ncbi:RNA polymerase sigma factor SigJ [Zavarzinia compransoris]|uniref:RNA polymerase sigma factor SigJ n=1 Tax=Zavarzinia marina TaxID=2911065 RepID=UPI001F3BCEA6|nr:RNA polymerase sigma factor SigJ [Zavarzinia marina]MCF4164155.1 RNA polymerase sigma factor SigJ [Zavarzinia marina]